jgi:hypothetical protein
MAKAKQKTRADILADIERVRIERGVAREEARRLTEAGAEAKVVEEKDDERKTRVFVRARRLDCFSLLLKDDAHAEARSAVNWLEELIRDASGENTQERRPDFIRASCEGAPGQNVTQRMIEASRTLEVVEASLRPWEARLLFELLRPDEALLTRWREVVKRVTTATTPQRQGERVIVACESLMWVRQNAVVLVKQRQEARAA